MVVAEIDKSWKTSDYNKLRIYIEYEDEKYIDIQDIKGYNPEALLGQVGGFIGIFVLTNTFSYRFRIRYVSN